MPQFRIDMAAQATTDLMTYRSFERKEIVTAIRQQLGFEPLTETANRKTLRVNALAAAWELRIGRFRVFYTVDVEHATVRILAIGHKVHNRLFVRGEEVQL